jgi:tetratricopeptide (TPR) repeat protein
MKFRTILNFFRPLILSYQLILLTMFPKFAYSEESLSLKSCKEASDLVEEGAEIADSSSEEKKLYEQAIKLCPKMSEAYHNLGIILIQDGEYQEALNLLEKAYRLNGQIETKLALASAEFKSGKLKKAKESYRAVLKSNPDHLKALQGLGVVLAASKDLTTSLSTLEKALKLDSSSEITLFNLAIISEKAKNIDKAITYYKNLIATGGKNREAFLRLSYLLLDKGEASQALSVIGKANEYYEGDEEVLKLRATIYEDLESFDEAEAIYKKLVSEDKSDVESLLRLGRLYLNSGQYAKSKHLSEQVIAQEPDNPYGYLLLGILELKADNYGEAEKLFKLSLTKDPTLSSTYEYLSMSQKLQNKEDMAEINLKKANELAKSTVSP